MKPSRKPRTAPKVYVDGPAMLQADHVQDRPYFIEVGTGKAKRSVKADGKAYRRASVLQKVRLAGQLIDRSKCTNRDATKAEEWQAERRYAAGKRFAEAWLLSNAGNWAMGADMNRVRCAGVPGSFADHALDEKQFLEDVRKALSVNDWMILRRVCGQNCLVAEAVTAISPSYRFSTLSRFREALDALVLQMGI